MLVYVCLSACLRADDENLGCFVPVFFQKGEVFSVSSRFFSLRWVKVTQPCDQLSLQSKTNLYIDTLCMFYSRFCSFLRWLKTGSNYYYNRFPVCNIIINTVINTILACHSNGLIWTHQATGWCSASLNSRLFVSHFHCETSSPVTSDHTLVYCDAALKQTDVQSVQLWGHVRFLLH